MNRYLRLHGNLDSRQFSNLLTTARDGVPVVLQGSREQVGGTLPSAQFNHTINHITINLDPAFNLPLPELAVVALMIRTFAEAGKQVVLEVPPLRKNTRQLHEYLSRTGFSSLMEQRNSMSWGAQVDIPSPLYIFPKRGREDFFTMTSKNVPLAWVDRHWFVGEGEGPSDNFVYWKLHPAIGDAYAKRLRLMIFDQGFADLDTAGIVVDLTLRELGWNAVLHSSEPGQGFGVAGMEIIEMTDGRRRLTLVVADAGVGIPFRLGMVHDAQSERYDQVLDECDRDTSIVRFALDAIGTSRPPESLGDPGQDRGLNMIAKALRDRGTLLLQSGTGRVTVDQGTPELGNLPSETALPGTLAVAEFVSRPAVRPSLGLDELPSLSLSTESVVTLPAELGASVEGAAEAFASLVGRGVPPDGPVVVDLGFNSLHARQLEALVKRCVKIYGGRLLIFWNVRNQWAEMDHVREWLGESAGRAGTKASVCLFAKGLADTRVLGSSRTQRERLRETPQHRLLSKFVEIPGGENAEEAQISGPSFMAIARAANDAYLADGFCYPPIEGEAAGFFAGQVHLFAGRVVPRFFSVLKNTENWGPRQRWVVTCAGAIAELIRERVLTTERVKLVGFAPSVEHLLEEVATILQLPSEPRTLKLFELEALEGTDLGVRPDAEVLLVTDVIATRTRSNQVLSRLGRAHVQAKGLVAIVDANPTPPPLDVPVRSCGQFPSGDLPTRTGESYWVDPVSLVPARDDHWAVPRVDIVESTVRILASSEALRCGHLYVWGRHSSLCVQVDKLLADNYLPVLSRVSEAIKATLETKGWKRFEPDLIVYPQGAGNSAATFSSALSGQLGAPLIVEVPRLFDESGRSLCARSIDLPDGAITKDVIIADDGLWTGRTIRSLIRMVAGLGARRIMVIPLVVRTSLHDVDFWDAISSMTLGSPTAAPVDTAWVLPLILPVPFTSRQGSWHELEREKLERFKGKPGVEVGTLEAVKRALAARSPEEPDPDYHTPTFKEAYLRLAVWAELSREYANASIHLASYIDSIDAPDALLALFTFFREGVRYLEFDWIRRAIADRLQVRAIQCVENSLCDVRLRISALRLLRWGFRAALVRRVEALTLLALESVEGLEESVFLLASLEAGEVDSGDLVRLYDAVAERYIRHPATHTGDDERLRMEAALGNLLTLTFIPKPPAAAVRAPLTTARQIDLLLSTDPIKHRVNEILKPFADIEAEGPENLNRMSASTFRILSKAWKELSRSLSHELLPEIGSLQKPLFLTLTAGERELGGPDVYYLSDRNSVNRIAEDMASLQVHLEFLAENPHSRRAAAVAIQKSAILHNLVTGERSRLNAIVNEMHACSVSHFMADLKETLRSRMELRGIPAVVNDRGSYGAIADRELFCPKALVDLSIDHILSNIEAHAFGGKSQRDDPKILIDALDFTSAVDASRPFNVRIMNNGSVFLGGGRSRAFSNLLTRMEAFGASISPARQTDEIGWSVYQELSIMVW